MKLASFIHRGRHTFGLVLRDGLFDLAARLKGRAATLDDVLRQGLLGELAAMARDALPEIKLNEVRFLPPLERPGKILCVGINYASRPGEHQKTEPPKPW